jgi:DinB superfamily
MGILTVARANTVQSNGLDVSGTGLLSIQQQATLAQQIRQATQDLETLLAGRKKIELLTPLQPESWCVAECLDHLRQTTGAFLPAISAAIAVAPKLKNNRRLRTGILPSLFIRNLNPPYRLRFKVFPQLAPQTLDSDTAWASFLQSQSELLGILSSTAGLAIDEVRIKSPVYGRISYNIYGALRMLAAHQRRHVWQISQILKVLDSRLMTSVA